MRQGGVAKRRNGPGLRVVADLRHESSHSPDRDKLKERKHFGEQGVRGAPARRKLAQALLQGEESKGGSESHSSSEFDLPPHPHLTERRGAESVASPDLAPRPHLSYPLKTPLHRRGLKPSGAGVFVGPTRSVSQTSALRAHIPSCLRLGLRILYMRP